MEMNIYSKSIILPCKALIMAIFIFFSNALFAQSMEWISEVLNPLLFKSTTKQAENAINSYWNKNLSTSNNYLFGGPSQVRKESMSDGHIVTIGIYGPEDEPWFVLYSIDGVLVKYKTLQ